VIPERITLVSRGVTVFVILVNFASRIQV